MDEDPGACFNLRLAPGFISYDKSVFIKTSDRRYGHSKLSRLYIGWMMMLPIWISMKSMWLAVSFLWCEYKVLLILMLQCVKTLLSSWSFSAVIATIIEMLPNPRQESEISRRLLQLLTRGTLNLNAAVSIQVVIQDIFSNLNAARRSAAPTTRRK